MYRISYFIASQIPVRLVATTDDPSASSISARGPTGPRVPALLNAMSRPPWRDAAVSMRRATSAGRVTSATTAIPRPPASTIRSTVSASGSGRRPATTTVAPARANASAVALPIPVPPPVTRTTFPE